MNLKTFLELLDNAEFLLILVVIYEISSIFLIKFKKMNLIIKGILIGLIGIIIMTVPYEFSSGLVFDTRSILLSATAIIFSGSTLLISATMMILYRIYMGGIGAFPGVLVITSVSLIGFFWKKYVFKHTQKHKWISIYAYGVLTHIAMLICMFALPYDIAISTLKELSFPVLIIYPIVTLLLTGLLIYQMERDSTSQRIKEAEERYRNLFENKNTVMFIVDPDTSLIVDANQAATDQYGYTKEEFINMKLTSLNTLNEREIRRAVQEAKDMDRNSFNFKHRKKDGTIIDVEVVSGPIKFDGKIFLYSIVIDITSRVKALQALENSEARFRLVVDHAPDAIFILSNFRFSFVNNAALQLFKAESQEEILYTWVLDRLHPDSRDKVKQRIEELDLSNGQILESNDRLITIDNETIEVKLTMVPILFEGIQAALVFVRDISNKIK